MEQGKDTLKSKSLVEQRLAEAMRDVREGRVQGPFELVEAVKRSLRRNGKPR